MQLKALGKRKFRSEMMVPCAVLFILTVIMTVARRRMFIDHRTRSGERSVGRSGEGRPPGGRPGNRPCRRETTVCRRSAARSATVYAARRRPPGGRPG